MVDETKKVAVEESSSTTKTTKATTKKPAKKTAVKKAATNGAVAKTSEVPTERNTVQQDKAVSKKKKQEVPRFQSRRR